jgi:hypothetical protein
MADAGMPSDGAAGTEKRKLCLVPAVGLDSARFPRRNAEARNEKRTEDP